MSGLSLETCTSNLKSVGLTVVELLSYFGAIIVKRPKIGGSRDLGHAPFLKVFKGRVRTVPGNTLVKFFKQIEFVLLFVPTSMKIL